MVALRQAAVIGKRPFMLHCAIYQRNEDANYEDYEPERVLYIVNL